MIFGPNIPVICYHAVSEAEKHNPEWFAAQLDVIRDMGLKTVSARHIYEIATGQRPMEPNLVGLSFDDCHVSAWLNIAPMLTERAMRGIFFAITDFVWDGPARTRDQVPPMIKASYAYRQAFGQGDLSQFCNRAELERMMSEYGHEVYSHSSRHQPCFWRPVPENRRERHWGCWAVYGGERPECPEFQVASGYAYNGLWPDKTGQKFRMRSEQDRLSFCIKDFSKSFRIIQEINKYDLQLFCWPWGHFDPVSEKALKLAGFKGAFTLERGPNAKGTNPFRINRIGVGPNKDAKWLRQRLKMYATKAGSMFFFKRYNKKPEPGGVMYATDAESLSGGVRQLLNNASSMTDFGIPVHAAVKPGSKVGQALREQGATCVSVDNFKKYFRTGRFFTKYTRQHKIDVIHTFHSKPIKGAVLSKLMAGRANVFINRGVIFQPNLIISLMALAADGVICNSFKCAEVLKKYLVPKFRLNVVYNSFTARLPELGQKSGEDFNVLFVGNTKPFKGFDVFLKMAESAIAAGFTGSFTAVGIKDMDIFSGVVPDNILNRVNSTGQLDHDQVLEQMGKADVLVLSSRQESMPNVMLEGFASGLPVVCTKAGGMPELVEDGVNGYVCPMEDHKALADKVLALAADPELARSMGQINRRVVSELLNNQAKGLNLLRVYAGQRLYNKLEIKNLTK